MKRTERFINSKLREMCIEHDWFTAGTNEEYDTLFRMADDFAHHDNENDRNWKLAAMASLIYHCSTEVSTREYDVFEIMSALQLCVIVRFEAV